MDRRAFLTKTLGVGSSLAAFAGLARAGTVLGGSPAHRLAALRNRPSYRGPRVILVRFGGGVRRRETIEENTTYAPYLLHRLVPRGTLFTNMEIDQFTQGERGGAKVETSHGQGTLHLMTGKYDSFVNRSHDLLGEDFEPTVPTLFEYLRRSYDLAPHETLIVNNENRPQEEYFTSSLHDQYGIDYRAEVLSLHRFKVFLREEELRHGVADDRRRVQVEKELTKLRSAEPQRTARAPSAALDEFWRLWKQHYGESGLVNPRGDALLTEIALWSLRHLKPRLLMINYTDPDYVHWGSADHYTRGIATIDAGLRQLVDAVDSDPEYRDDTVFAIVPDCGRDDNRLLHVPFQHHFNSKSARRIWALFFGPGVVRGARVDRRTEQVEVAATLGQRMGFPTEFAEGAALTEALS